MLHGPRSARPFGEFVAALAAAGIPCRWSLLIEGGGLATLGAQTRRIASAFLAFSSADSLARARCPEQPGGTAPAVPRRGQAASLAADVDKHRCRTLRHGPLRFPGPADPRGLGGMRRHAPGRGPSRDACGERARLRLRRHRRTGAGAAGRGLAHVPGEPARRLRSRAPEPSLPLARRTDAPLQLRDGRRLRTRSHLRHPGARQVGAAERAQPGLVPAERPRRPAARRRHRHRPLLDRPHLVVARGVASRAPPRGRRLAPHDDGRMRHQPLRHPARMPPPASRRTPVPDEPPGAHPDARRRSRRSRRRARGDRPDDRRGLCHEERRIRRRRTGPLHPATATLPSTRRWRSRP